VLELPLIVLLQKHGTDEAHDGAFVGKDTDHVGAAFHLLVQSFDRVRAVDFAAVLGGEVHVRQHVGLALVDERAELGPFGPKMVGDMPERLGGAGAIGLDERLPKRGRDRCPCTAC
jgi:hypothetical protein